jgi:hypothetical protein
MYKCARYPRGNATILVSDRVTITMNDDVTNMFSVASTQQSPLDEPFFTFSAMLRHACTVQDLASMYDNSFFDKPAGSNAISMEEILPFEVYQDGPGDWNEYSHNLDLCDGASPYGISDSEEKCVTKTSIRT